MFWSPCPRRGTGMVQSSVRHLDPASSALPQIGSPLPLASARNHGGFSSNEALRTRGGQAGFLGWQTTTVLIPRLLTKSQHPPGPAWRCPGKGKGPCGPRRGLAQAGASCHSPGGRGVALPDSHAAGQSPEGSAAPPAAGLGSGSGLRSSVARGAGVCAACRGRAIPSPSRRPCLQRQPELLPGRLPANHRGNPRGQGCSTMVTGEARGVIGGALEPDHGMLADLGGCQQPAKLRAGFVLSRTLRGPTNQSNTRVSSRRSRSGTFLVQGVWVPIAFPSIPH